MHRPSLSRFFHFGPADLAANGTIPGGDDSSFFKTSPLEFGITGDILLPFDLGVDPITASSASSNTSNLFFGTTNFEEYVEIDVTYDYTPAPEPHFGAVVFLGFAIIVVFVRRHRRRLLPGRS